MTNEYMDEFINQTRAADCQAMGPNSTDQWDAASELFPRQPFPWDAFPTSIVESLKQVARSCATSDVSMPGIALAIMASVLGRTISVSPKTSWNEPLTIWVADIRSSGAGKTPAARMLLDPVYAVQKEKDESYLIELDQWEKMPKKNKGAPPKRPAAHYVTDLTLEGLRMDVQQGHGGLVCVMDEISSMISSQDQYRQKGNDRESWLALWDGKPARITRAGKSITINGARVSMFGGIQPAVFKVVFGGSKGLYTADGTIFRFLLTYEMDAFVPLTSESWNIENRKIWESTLENAIRWSEGIITSPEWQPHILRLTDGARTRLIDYRNGIFRRQNLLPIPIQGFIPKSISYILRIAGILHCMFRFVHGIPPGKILEEDDISRAISVMEFYLAHAVSAAGLIHPDFSAAGPRSIASSLAKTLYSLRSDLDAGRLAVGYIYEKYNEQCSPEQKIKSERAMGTILRDHKLTVSPGKYNANGRRGVCCLTWDKETDEFVQTLRTSANQSQHDENRVNTGGADIADIADFVGEEYDIEGDTV